HGEGQAEVHQAGDAMLGDAAGDDTGEMGKVRLHVQADAVEADPFAQLHADGGDLVLSGEPGGFALHPDADAAWADLAVDIEAGEGGDHPGLEGRDEGAKAPPRAGRTGI